jgi:spermidine/putrescine transport system permease protein
MAIAHVSPGTSTHVNPTRTGRKIPYLLMLPGLLWLAVFFIYPLINLAETSTKTRAESQETGAFVQTYRFANYLDAFVEYQDQFIRSFTYALMATLLALAISIGICDCLQGWSL